MAAKIPDDTYTPETQNRDSDRRVLIVTGGDVEDLEFYYPYYRFIEAGFAVDVATPDGGEFNGKHGLPVKQSMMVAAIDPLDYDLLYLPGGQAPAKLKKNEDVLALVRQYFNGGKPICAVCHGPQILAAAGVIQSRRISGWPEIEGEITDAGGIYMNEETMADDRFITGRWPADLPALMARTLGILGVEAAFYAGDDGERPGAGVE
jgi:protease I